MKAQDESTTNPAAPASESQWPELISAIFTLFNVLSIHKTNNDAVHQRIAYLKKVFDDLWKITSEKKPITVLLQDDLFVIHGQPIPNHFSFSDAYEGLRDVLRRALIEEISFHPHLPMAGLSDFLIGLFQHWKTKKYPQKWKKDVDGIEVRHGDWSRYNPRWHHQKRFETSIYALQNYYFFRSATEDFLRSMTQEMVPSQKVMRHGLLVLWEWLEKLPHRFVALSCFREEAEDVTSLAPQAAQAAATSLLSMALSHELRMPLSEQVNIGMMGLVYNVGLLGKESSILLKDDRLTAVEYKKVLDAQAAGVCKLLKSDASSRPVIDRVLAIFEMTRKPENQSIQLKLESRILRLTSQYVALTSERPFREAYTPFEAVKLLGSKAAGGSASELDPLLYYLFVRLIGFYPIGSLVLLSNGKKAVVFKSRGERQGAPVVKVLSEGAAEAEIVDLGQVSSLEIVKSLDPKREGIRVTGYLFE